MNLQLQCPVDSGDDGDDNDDDVVQCRRRVKKDGFCLRHIVLLTFCDPPHSN